MRRVVFGALVLALILVGCGSDRQAFEEPVVLEGDSVSPELLNRGALVYVRYCRGCHGQEGRGDGPYATSMEPRPANLRELASDGELPAMARIRRAVVEGVEGTPMGPQGIDGEALDGVVRYTQWLATDVQRVQ